MTEGYLRYVKDFLGWELARLRPGWSPSSWAPDALLEKEPLLLDSLELVELAGLLSDRFHVREVGTEELLLARRTPRGWAELLADVYERGVSQISFFTSGSSGQPKKADHTWYWLLQEAGFFANLLVPQHVIKAVPSHHIYGFLWTWLLPEAAKVNVEEISPEAPIWNPGDLVVTTPFLLHLWLERGISVRGAIFALSSAPFPDADAHKLLSLGASYIEIFGSSETAGIGWRTSPDVGFKLLPWWNLMDDSLVRTSATGTRETLLLPDHVEAGENGLVKPTGRKDQAVQVAGINVSLFHVEKVLADCPGVHQVVVRVAASGRLKAFVVPWQDQILTDTILRAWSADHLTPPERPATFTLGTEIPRSAVGKHTDW